MKTPASLKTQKHPLRSKQKNFFVFVLSCFFVFVLSVIPVHAQVDQACRGGVRVLADAFNFFTCILSQLIVPILFGVALVVFIGGIILYFLGADDETKKAEGRKFIIWGIIGLFVIVSIWGIVSILSATVIT